MKLLKKLLLMVLMTVFVASSVIGGVSVMKSYQATEKMTLESMEQTTTLNANLINDKLEATVRMVEIVGDDIDVIKALKENKSPSEVINSLTKIVEQNSDLIGMIALINRNDMVYTSDRINDLKGIDVSEREYLIEAKTEGKTVISEVITSKADGSQVVVVCEPIYDNGKYVGSVLSTIKFNLVTDLIDPIKVGENGYAFLIDIKGDDAGLTVDHPNADFINKMSLYDLENDELDALADKMQVNNEGFGSYVYDGDEKYVQYHKIAGNWSLGVTANADELERTSREILITTIVVMIVMIIITTGVGYFVVMFMIVKPITKLQDSMAAVGAGDLTNEVHLKTNDEISMLADDYNIMLSNQKAMINEINNISTDMTASAEELSASAQEVNDSANEVSNNIQDMMSNIMNENEEVSKVTEEINEMNSSIEASGVMIRQSKAACDESLIVASEGREGIKSSVESIENISTSTLEVMKAFNELTSHTQQVTGISEIISNIASQINLLALNASIEAARAGEAGRGFTVVADEVRKLAEQTSSESENISSVLSEITKLVEEANVTVNNTKSYVDQGEETIHSLDGKFLEIIETFNNLNQYIVNLLDISVSQTSISDGIRGSIVEVSETTDSNVSSAQEISAAAEEQSAITDNLSQSAEETSSMAEQMNGLIEQFKL